MICIILMFDSRFSNELKMDDETTIDSEAKNEFEAAWQKVDVIIKKYSVSDVDTFTAFTRVLSAKEYNEAFSQIHELVF